MQYRDGLGRCVGYDPKLGRRVELIVLELGESESRADELRERAQVLAQLVEPSLVRAHDVGTENDQLFIAVDHLDGTPLGEWLSQSRGWRQTTSVVAQVGDGLVALARERLVHHAIGLGAVFVGDERQARVSGFFGGRVPKDATLEQDALDFARLVYRALWGRTPPASNEDGGALGVPLDRRLPLSIRREVAAALDPQVGRSVAGLTMALRRATRSSRRWLWSATVSVAAAAAVLVQVGSSASAETAHAYCDGIQARVGDAWNGQKRQNVDAAIESLGIEFARESWSRASGELDAFASELTDAQNAACSAREGGEPDDAQSLCLHRKLEQLRSLGTSLEQADVVLIANLSEAVERLGSVQECEPGVATDFTPPSEDLEASIEIEAHLSESRNLMALGQAQDGLEAARAALVLAEEIDLNYYVCEAEYAIGVALMDLDNPDALDALHRAFAAGLAAKHDAQIVDVATLLGASLGEEARYEEANSWFQHAAAALEREPNERSAVALSLERSTLLLDQGKYVPALAQLTEVEATVHETFGIRLRTRARQLLAEAHYRSGQPEEAVEILRRLVTDAETELGTKHPVLGGPLIALARDLDALGRTEESLVAAERAATLMADAYGPTHYGSLAAHSELMNTLVAAGENDRVEDLAPKLLADAREGLGIDDARYPGMADSVARALFIVGKRTEAIELFIEAVERSDAIDGPDHPASLLFLNNLAASLMLTGSFSEAEDRYRDVMARQQRVLGPNHRGTISSRLGLGATLQRQDRAAEAVPVLEEALSIAEDVEFQIDNYAQIEFELAQAVWDAGKDEARAMTLVNSAQRHLRQAQEQGTNVDLELQDIQNWLVAVQKTEAPPAKPEAERADAAAAAKEPAEPR